MYATCTQCGVTLRAVSKLIPELVAEFSFGLSVFVGLLFWYTESKTIGVMFNVIAILCLFVPQYFGKTEVIGNDL